LGMLVAAPTKDYSQTVMVNSSEFEFQIGDWLTQQFAPLEEQAKAEMSAEGHTEITLNHSLDMRYKGQSHELNIPITNDHLPIATLFHKAHHSRYGYAQDDEPVEIVTIRLSAVAPVTPPQLWQSEVGEADASAAVVGSKAVWFAQQPLPTTLYDRDKLKAGHTLRGPAVIFQYDTTTVIPPHWQADIDSYQNMILTPRPA
ncbi:MAG: hypothetical protein KDE51_02875, partial [Anaerolineales bacterium]|nr:hypothetical protein [Anaerolineales bacterium]